MRLRSGIVLAAIWLAATSCNPGPQLLPEVTTMNLQLTSSVFSDGGAIPARHTCDGDDAPIPLDWSGLPDGTAELALVMDDPDARGFVHWLLVGIPPTAEGIGEASLPPGAREGRNDFGGTGYRGPCPPSGTHRYVLTLYALARPLELSAAPTADDVRRAASGITLAQAQLAGAYGRR